MARLNLGGAQLVIEQSECFAGKPVLVVTGSHDADHPRAIDGATADWFRGLGADVDHRFLADHGISGNGHMLMSERNSTEIADDIANWLTDRAGAGD